jgi:hypothetical protein
VESLGARVEGKKSISISVLDDVYIESSSENKSEVIGRGGLCELGDAGELEFLLPANHQT